MNQAEASLVAMSPPTMARPRYHVEISELFSVFNSFSTCAMASAIATSSTTRIRIHEYYSYVQHASPSGDELSELARADPPFLLGLISRRSSSMAFRFISQIEFSSPLSWISGFRSQMDGFSRNCSSSSSFSTWATASAMARSSWNNKIRIQHQIFLAKYTNCHIFVVRIINWCVRSLWFPNNIPDRWIFSELLFFDLPFDLCNSLRNSFLVFKKWIKQ